MLAWLVAAVQQTTTVAAAERLVPWELLTGEQSIHFITCGVARSAVTAFCGFAALRTMWNLST